MSLCLRVLRDGRPYWGHFLLAFLLSLLSAPIVMLVPVPLKLAVDSVLDRKPPPGIMTWLLPQGWLHSPAKLLAAACMLSFAFILLQSLHGFLTWVYQRHIAESSIVDIRGRLFAHVQSLSLRQHDRLGLPELYYCLNNDVAAMQYVVVGGLLPFFTSIVTFFAVLWVTWRLDWRFGTLALGAVPVLWVLGRYHSPRSRARWTRVKETERDALGVIQEKLGAIRVVKAFARESREVERYRERAWINVHSHVRAAWMELVYGMATATVVACVSAGALYLGVIQVQSGTLSLGNLLVLMAYLALLFKPIETLGKQISLIQTAMAGADRVYALMARAPEVVDPASPIELGRASGAIEMRDVTVRYATDRVTLENISLAIEPGTHVGILGPTGTGKTTLLQLLMRLLDPSSGSVHLDGIDIRRLCASDLRRQFAVVSQDAILFSTTIAENIAYGVEGVDLGAIQAAARAAHIHDFISGLPEGYDTQVGERGMSLSGGERQRLSLARALLLDAPILILDEPTSAVDEATEASIAPALRDDKRGRTTLTVTHRPSLLKHCDRWLYIERGGVRELGREAVL